MLLGTKGHKKEEHQGHKRELKSIKQIYNTSFKINAMQYPLISEYVRAIQDSQNNLDQLAHLTPVLDSHGEPYRSSGAFAVVFKMKDEQTGKCYALKCFTEEQEGRAEAYRKIADELEFVNTTYVTSVRYMEKELFVDCNCDDEEFPVLLMDWIDGETMETYIADNFHDSYAMSMLCFRFCKMAAWLRSQPFAHGDIKPDNIMVRPDGTITLVDYDGMFVPAMKGQKSPTIGTKDFSHPLRSVDDFDENIDDFALASIALSLKALSLKPSLWNDFGASDRLLFSTNDYLDLSKSKVHAAMQELLTDEDMKTLLSLFLLASAKKDLSMCSFRTFAISKPDEAEGILKQGKKYCNGWDGFVQDRCKAFLLFNQALKQGDIEAKWCLGCCYKNGYGVSVDLEKSNLFYKEVFEDYKIRAERGNAEYQWRLGRCYEFGRGVDKDYVKAVEWYRKSAEQGNTEGQWLLGRCYEFGWGVYKDDVKAVEWYKKSAEQGDSDGQWRLGNCYKLGHGIEKNKVKAIVWYRKSAEQGNAEGQWRLGLCYEDGEGVDKDYVKAVEWYRKSAEQGNSDGQWRLGLCYKLGQGIEKNYVKAIEWYRKSAEQGDSDGQWRLGYCYENGDGVEKNLVKAIELYWKSAEQGNTNARLRLSDCYCLGIGVDKDNYKAVEWYKKFAEHGYSDAQWRLGNCYKLGQGIEKNDVKAIEWYRKSAEQGNAEVQWRLGYCYEHGIGVERNYAKAYKLYNNAAEQNNEKGLYFVGHCYEEGIGVPQNINKATEWYKKAANKGNSQAKAWLQKNSNL